jgi:hypothetical protein
MFLPVSVCARAVLRCFSAVSRAQRDKLAARAMQFAGVSHTELENLSRAAAEMLRAGIARIATTTHTHNQRVVCVQRIGKNCAIK